MSDPAVWRIVPKHHLVWWQRFVERVFGGTFIWCPEVTQHREWTRELSRG